jgi:hypothetical protein
MCVFVTACHSLLPAALAGLLSRLPLSSLPFHCTSRCPNSSSSLQVVLVQRGNMVAQVLQQLAVVPLWPLVIWVSSVWYQLLLRVVTVLQCIMSALRTCCHIRCCCVMSGLDVTLQYWLWPAWCLRITATSDRRYSLSVWPFVRCCLLHMPWRTANRVMSAGGGCLLSRCAASARFKLQWAVLQS